MYITICALANILTYILHTFQPKTSLIVMEEGISVLLQYLAVYTPTGFVSQDKLGFSRDRKYPWPRTGSPRLRAFPEWASFYSCPRRFRRLRFKSLTMRSSVRIFICFQELQLNEVVTRSECLLSFPLLSTSRPSIYCMVFLEVFFLLSIRHIFINYSLNPIIKSSVLWLSSSSHATEVRVKTLRRK